MQINNYTQISNDFIDNMGRYSGSAVKIFMAISRKTIGWHKLTDRISYSQLTKITGIKSHHTLKECIQELLNDEWIIQSESKFGYVYDLNICEPMAENAVPMAENASEPMAKNANTKDIKTKETNNLIKINKDIEEIIKTYPNICPIKQIRLYPDTKENRNKIKKLLKTYPKEEIIRRIGIYLAESKTSWLKTFKNMLDVVPSITGEIKINQEDEPDEYAAYKNAY